MKLCDTCIYRNNVEQLKPCIIYRDNCEYYEKERDTTTEEAISIMNVIVHMLEPQYDTDRVEDAVDMAIKALNREPRITGKWTSECEPDNRDAEPKDITDEYFHESNVSLVGYTVTCPHCGCTLTGFAVMSNHYCYVCGGKFGRKMLPTDDTREDDEE